MRKCPAHYAAAQALFGIGLEVGKGETVVLVGGTAQNNRLGIPQLESI